MMQPFSISELVRPLFRQVGGEGKIAVFQFYFDDSGTHSGSLAVVWGGVVGTVDEFEAFEVAWRGLLDCPLEGKPSIKKMHLSDLRSRKGDFIDYNQGEVDLVTKKCRDILIESSLECVAWIVLTKDFELASSVFDRMLFGGARNLALHGVLNFVSRCISRLDQDISCHFDVGARDFAMPLIEEAWRKSDPEVSKRSHFTFSSVERILPLQAADLVAYEAYQYGLHLHNPIQYPENPHFINLRNRANVVFYSLHEKHIRDFFTKMTYSIYNEVKSSGPQI